jgi:hypothetical protein
LGNLGDENSVYGKLGFRVIEYPDFGLMVWNLHPAVKKGVDFDSIAKVLPDFRHAVIEAAEFILANETKSLLYDVIMISELHDIKLKVYFPFMKGRGQEAKPFSKKRIVKVEILALWKKSDEEYSDQPLATVFGWDLGERFECSGG